MRGIWYTVTVDKQNIEEYPGRDTARPEAFERQAREQKTFTGLLLLRLFVWIRS